MFQISGKEQEEPLQNSAKVYIIHMMVFIFIPDSCKCFGFLAFG